MPHTHFKELQEWSERKHELVIRYLQGFARILGGSTKGVVYYVDGFAGPGIYGDGSKGSPIRAAEYAQTLVGNYYQVRCINVEVDTRHFENLEKSMAPYAAVATNYHGRLADHVDTVLGVVGSRPAIFFLDPFGLKGIEWKHIYPLLQRPHTTEVLLRVNPRDIYRLAGFAHTDSRGAPRKRQVLTNLYGFSDSAQWEEVWDTHGTEGLTRLYIARLQAATAQWGRKSYVCSYAIKSVRGRLKYYLIFATRHPRGAILMSDIVYGREKCYKRDVKEAEEERLQSRSARQLSMFEVLYPPPTEADISASLVERLKEDVWELFQGKASSRTDVHEAMLPKWFGRISGSHITQALKALEEEGRIRRRSGACSKANTEFFFRDP